jgi:crotonobetainyl-CoA:carnitine CoA-transferase CaiB-like acyl-CoA transferase
MGMLDGIRVIDLGQYVSGPLAAMILADQGADVIHVDPPGGPRLITGANATWNRNKRTIEIDLKSTDGLATVRGLIGASDVLIENFRPGVMDRLGIGPGAMLPANPTLVYCSLPGFAPQDQRAAMPAWEGAVSAATALYRRSVYDKQGGPPVYTAEPVASSFGAFVAVTAIGAALHARERDGAGQHLQIPLFDAMYQAIGFVGLRIAKSGKGVHAVPAWDGQYRCGDGRWIHLVGTTQSRGERFTDALGLPDWRDAGLIDQERLLREPSLNEELARRLKALFATRTASEWEELLGQINFPAAACRTTAEWHEHEHARAAGLVASIDDDARGPMLQPGPAITTADERPPIRARTRLNDARDAWPTRGAPAGTPVRETRARAPFEGIRVLDLCIVLAGPVCARTLAEMGADVIKIDDPRRERNSYHLDINRGKRSILLDLRTEGGMSVFWQLVDAADVIVQNFRSGAVERLGIDYESVRRRKPDIVYGSITAYGDEGPWASRGGYEETVQAITGMQVRFGGAERPALLPYAVNDYGTGLLAAHGIALALWHRQRTGEGRHVKAALARTAGMIQSWRVLSPSDEDVDEHGGQSSRGAGPLQRLYRASDGWVFVGGGHAAAARLHRIPGLEDAASLDAESLERRLEARFADVSADEWVEALRGLGFGAHRALRVSQAMSDPIAVARGLGLTREHAGHGAVRHNGPGQWFSASETVAGRPTPIPGADAASVLGDIGRAGDLDSLVASGAVTLPDRA